MFFAMFVCFFLCSFILLIFWGSKSPIFRIRIMNCGLIAVTGKVIIMLIITIQRRTMEFILQFLIRIVNIDRFKPSVLHYINFVFSNSMPNCFLPIFNCFVTDFKNKEVLNLQRMFYCVLRLTDWQDQCSQELNGFLKQHSTDQVDGLVLFPSCIFYFHNLFFLTNSCPFMFVVCIR